MRWNTVSSGKWVRGFLNSTRPFVWHRPYLIPVWKFSAPYYTVTLWCKLKFSLHEVQTAVIICADTIKLKSRSQDTQGINPAWPLDIAKASGAREIPRKLQEQLWTCLRGEVVDMSVGDYTQSEHQDHGISFSVGALRWTEVIVLLKTRTDDGAFTSAFCHGERRKYLLQTCS